MDRDETQADDVNDEATDDETRQAASTSDATEEPEEVADLAGEEADEASQSAETAPEEAEAVGSENDEPPVNEEPVAVPVRPRSAPRYGTFIGVGAIFGILIALILSVALPSDGGSSPVTALLYLIVLLAPLTALLGGLLAVIFEKRSK